MYTSEATSEPKRIGSASALPELLKYLEPMLLLILILEPFYVQFMKNWNYVYTLENKNQN